MMFAEQTTFIRQLASEAGFDAVEFAHAVPLTDEMKRYQEWIARGFHGVMGYMERRLEEREHITSILPGAQSVIVLAKNYYTPWQHQQTTGKIARYAWGDDYHDVLPDMLEHVCSRLTEQYPEVQTKWYVDTGPVLEKQWAVHSGLGWQGKHSNIIRRDIGSWFFIAVIYTTLKLEASAPIADFCGTCTACIDACPTGAIVEPYVVDSNKCISHWTIEAKPHHIVPEQVSENLDGWLFGCDVCQEVCPWNRFSKPTTEQRFAPRDGRTGIAPEVVVNLQPEVFQEQARQSPLKRPKLFGLQRTAEALIHNLSREENSEKK